MNMKLKQISLISFLGLLLVLTPAWAAEDSIESRVSNYEKAVSFFSKDQFDLAIEFFEKALQDDHGPSAQARIYNLIGLSYLKQGVSISSAVGSFEQAIKLDPRFAEAYFNIASAYAGNNSDPAKAVEYFQKTVEIDPHFFKAYFGLGWFTLMQKDDPAKAIDYFQKTLDQYPEFGEALYGIGLAYIRTHKPHMALGSVTKLRDLKRDDLATALERAITEVSPPTEAKPVAQVSADTPEKVSKPRANSPFEVVMKGKLVPPQKNE